MFSFFVCKKKNLMQKQEGPGNDWTRLGGVELDEVSREWRIWKWINRDWLPINISVAISGSRRFFLFSRFFLLKAKRKVLMQKQKGPGTIGYIC